MMKYKYPMYYQSFQCTAQACEATCCAGWEIVIDEESIENYLGIKTEFGNRLCNSIDFEEGIFYQDEKKRCAFLNEDNLCDIYSELGEEALCYTCTQYPRHIEEFEEINEVSLSISCPEVANMILNCKEKVSFYEEYIEEAEEAEEYEDFDFLFYELLYEAREIIFAILQNREIPIQVRMELTASMTKEIQEKIDEYDVFLVEEIMQRYEEINLEDGKSWIEEKVVQSSQEKERVSREKALENLMDLFQLEALQEEWQPYVLASYTRLQEMPYEIYTMQYQEFQKQYQEALDRMKEQLMVYYIYSYYCGAVYDAEVYCKYVLAHITTSNIETLWFLKYMENGGEISDSEIQRIVYHYAREIEHSDQNLEILEAIYRVKEFEL